MICALLRLQDPTQVGTCRTWNDQPEHSKATPDAYIVRFNVYKMAAEHRGDVTRCLGEGTGNWSWIDRNNRAMAYPTDFGLLQLAAGAMEASMVSPHNTAAYIEPMT